ncbi:MAG TPA: hypothetical protein VGI31_12580 [Streptosporangiaceae bacterium]
MPFAPPVGVADAAGLGDGLVADGLGDALADGLEADGLGDTTAGVILGGGVWPVRDAVVAVGRDELAPPTAQASRPSTARPAASANSLRRQ